MSGGGKRTQESASWRQRAAEFRVARVGSMRTQLEAKSEHMMQEAASTRRGTRVRGIPMAGVGLALLTFLLSMVYQSILAVNFTTGNKQMEIYSNYLDAAQAAGYLAPTSQQDNSEVGALQLGIKTAKLAGFCAIAKEDILGLPYSLVITAGATVPDSYTGLTANPGGTTTDLTNGKLNGTSLAESITANNLFLDSTGLNGFGNLISGMNLGQSATTVTQNSGLPFPTGDPNYQTDTAAVPGNFGLYASQLNVAGLGGESYGLNLAGDITLPKLKIAVASGNKTQADCG